MPTGCWFSTTTTIQLRHERRKEIYIYLPKTIADIVQTKTLAVAKHRKMNKNNMRKQTWRPKLLVHFMCIYYYKGAKRESSTWEYTFGVYCVQCKLKTEKWEHRTMRNENGIYWLQICTTQIKCRKLHERMNKMPAIMFY